MRRILTILIAAAMLAAGAPLYDQPATPPAHAAQDCVPGPFTDCSGGGGGGGGDHGDNPGGGGGSPGDVCWAAGVAQADDYYPIGWYFSSDGASTLVCGGPPYNACRRGPYDRTTGERWGSLVHVAEDGHHETTYRTVDAWSTACTWEAASASCVSGVASLRFYGDANDPTRTVTSSSGAASDRLQPGETADCPDVEFVVGAFSPHDGHHDPGGMYGTEQAGNVAHVAGIYHTTTASSVTNTTGVGCDYGYRAADAAGQTIGAMIRDEHSRDEALALLDDWFGYVYRYATDRGATHQEAVEFAGWMTGVRIGATPPFSASDWRGADAADDCSSPMTFLRIQPADGSHPTPTSWGSCFHLRRDVWTGRRNIWTGNVYVQTVSRDVPTTGADQSRGTDTDRYHAVADVHYGPAAAVSCFGGRGEVIAADSEQGPDDLDLPVPTRVEVDVLGIPEVGVATGAFAPTAVHTDLQGHSTVYCLVDRNDPSRGERVCPDSDLGPHLTSADPDLILTTDDPYLRHRHDLWDHDTRSIWPYDEQLTAWHYHATDDQRHMHVGVGGDATYVSQGAYTVQAEACIDLVSAIASWQHGGAEPTCATVTGVRQVRETHTVQVEARQPTRDRSYPVADAVDGSRD